MCYTSDSNITKKGTKLKPKQPYGFDYCKDCEQSKPLEDFPNSPGSYCRQCQNIRTKNSPNFKANVRKAQLKRNYSTTPEHYDKLFEKQQGVCAVCASPETAKGKSLLSIDQDKTTGFIRGLLCHNCNIGIGKLRDNIAILKSAIWYLEKSQVELENQIRNTMTNNLEETN